MRSIIWDFRVPDKGAEDTKPETPTRPGAAVKADDYVGSYPRRRKPGENPTS